MEFDSIIGFVVLPDIRLHLAFEADLRFLWNISSKAVRFIFNRTTSQSLYIFFIFDAN